jgi:cell division protein FtsB
MALGWRGSYTRYKEFFLNISALYKKRPDLRAFLEIILSLSTVIIFLLFALKPTVITIISLLQQIKEKQSTLSVLTQKVADLQVAGNLLQQNQSFIPIINIAVPSRPSPNTLSEQALGLAAKNSASILGVSINQITLMGVDTSKGVPGIKPLPANAKEMSFSISVRGPFSNLAAFIRDFENSRIVKKIDTLGISSSVTDKGLVIVAIISGRVPYLGK